MSLDVIYSSTCRLVWYLCWTNQCDKFLRIRIWPSRQAREWNKNKLKVLETFEASTFSMIFFKKYSLLHNKCICWLNKFRHSTCLVFFPWLLKLEQIPDSQMFVKVYPQHLTLVFSDQAPRKKWLHFTKPYHILFNLTWEPYNKQLKTKHKSKTSCIHKCFLNLYIKKRK